MSTISSSDQITKVSYKPGDYIFFEGDIESHFYIIENGIVQIYTKSADGKRINICEINSGESFGEFALLDQKPRSASAQAITDVTLVRVSAQGYEELLQDLPVWAVSMLRSFADRLKKMTKTIKDIEQFAPRR